MDFLIPEPKITRYLLGDPRKSGYFLRFGYTVQDWTRLLDDLLNLARNRTLTYLRNSASGKKYQIEGEILAPDGGTINLTTGWMVRNDDPRHIGFVTAYPT